MMAAGAEPRTVSPTVSSTVSAGTTVGPRRRVREIRAQRSLPCRLLVVRSNQVARCLVRGGIACRTLAALQYQERVCERLGSCCFRKALAPSPLRAPTLLEDVAGGGGRAGRAGRSWTMAPPPKAREEPVTGAAAAAAAAAFFFCVVAAAPPNHCARAAACSLLAVLRTRASPSSALCATDCELHEKERSREQPTRNQHGYTQPSTHLIQRHPEGRGCGALLAPRRRRHLETTTVERGVVAFPWQRLEGAALAANSRGRRYATLASIGCGRGCGNSSSGGCCCGGGSSSSSRGAAALGLAHAGPTALQAQLGKQLLRGCIITESPRRGHGAPWKASVSTPRRRLVGAGFCK